LPNSPSYACLGRSNQNTINNAKSWID
jgi:hypothetical protein